MYCRTFLLVTFAVVLPASAADWPQWRGLNRDAKVTGFNAPSAWPKTLTKKWSVNIGDGVATPALVGDKLYTYSREEDDEVARCLDAATGKELWQDKLPATRPTGGAGGFPGPRSSPTVVDGMVVTFGVDSTLTCFDAKSGAMRWRKDNLGDVPTFFTSASPVVTEGPAGERLVIVQFGGERGGGGVVAYRLASGERKWFWKGEGAGYGSPALMTVGETPVVVVPTSASVVALNPTDGTLLWKTPFPTGQRLYNAATPVVNGPTMIYSGSGRGRGTKAFRFEKTTAGADGKELWQTADTAVQFNTPVLKDGWVYGISDEGKLFCLDGKTGSVAWSAALPRPTGGRTRPGYGSVVDAGTVLFALTPAGELVAFEPSDKEFKKLASYQVAPGDTYAYPVIADKRIFVKDKNAVTLWTLE